RGSKNVSPQMEEAKNTPQMTSYPSSPESVPPSPKIITSTVPPPSQPLDMNPSLKVDLKQSVGPATPQSSHGDRRIIPAACDIQPSSSLGQSYEWKKQVKPVETRSAPPKAAREPEKDMNKREEFQTPKKEEVQVKHQTPATPPSRVMDPSPSEASTTTPLIKKEEQGGFFSKMCCCVR
ncbi:hypothetical protein PROFUN_16881, partial [Planoprotostelium fungivorum]